ncbi:MAG: hypothetical protein A3G81_28695 [Betaproteobacteria bacterium RIFCSPLOWO2_12_FULL_65_14]|nr:MAG: hypothetical protein A3G81_28695 [Betaproteobacteria bacterium RIFCSPLOWO2_12_FULL_65_14]
MSTAHETLPRGTRLFITGGTGFVGRTLLRAVLDPSLRLVANDIRITILSRTPDRFLAEHPALARDKRIDWVQGDVRSFLAPQERYTHVIHAATDTSAAAAQRPLELIDEIVSGTRRVLDFAARCSAQKVVFTSSGSVYGSQPAQVERLEETFSGAPDPADPASASGQAKRLAEQLCAIAYHESRLPVKVARLFAFVGEELPLDAHFAIGNFIRDAVAGRPIDVQGDGSPVRSYLYGGDLAAWLVTILERGRPNRPYNVGSDQAISIADLAHRVADLVAPGTPVRIAGRRADYAGRLRYVPSIERTKADLGLRVETPLDEAIRRTAAWHRRI